MKLRYKILIPLSLLLIAFLFGRCQRQSAPAGSPPPAVLPLDDREQIQVNPGLHTLIVLRPGQKEEKLTLPDHPTIIDIKKDNTVNVIVPQFGYEQRPFIGVSISDRGRFIAGGDVFYYKHLDIGPGVGIQKDLASFVFIIKLSYVVYSNTSLGLIVDNQKHIGGSLTVRL